MDKKPSALYFKVFFFQILLKAKIKKIGRQRGKNWDSVFLKPSLHRSRMKNFSDPTARPRPVAMVTQMLEQKQALHTRTHTTQVKVF